MQVRKFVYLATANFADSDISLTITCESCTDKKEPSDKEV